MTASADVPRASKMGKLANSPPRRLNNRARRTREHLTPAEVDQLIEAARQVGRHAHRDATLILIAYRHGLRVAELGRVTLGTSRFKSGVIARASSQAWHPLDPSPTRPRAAGATTLAAGIPGNALRVCLRTESASDYQRGAQNHRPRRQNRGSGVFHPPAHAASCNRVQAGQRRARYPRHPALPGAPEHPEHGAVYRALTGSIQGVLAGLDREREVYGRKQETVDPQGAVTPSVG